MAGLLDKLLEKVGERRESAPVFRIREHSIPELEDRVLHCVSRLPGYERCPKARIDRREKRSLILLPDGQKATVFHGSGAFRYTAGFAPMERLIGSKADRNALEQSAIETAKQLDLLTLGSPDESLDFERLWLIKAAGMTREGKRGETVICRAVGAFRRKLDGLPVLGRASAVIELAESNSIAGIGVDWRPVSEGPVDEVKLIDPEQAARAVIGDIDGRFPGRDCRGADFDVAMFRLGYMSLPKRREQAHFAPVYVALLERRGWSSMNYAVTVGASMSVHEQFCRTANLPPIDARMRRPGVGRKASAD